MTKEFPTELLNKLECNMGKDAKGVEHREPWKAYDIDEVDSVLADKDAEIRNLKRALWLARAERAASWQIHFSLCHNYSIERQFSINGASMPCEGMLTMRTARDWAMIWEKVERKCRAKAEEYK